MLFVKGIRDRIAWQSVKSYHRRVSEVLHPLRVGKNRGGTREKPRDRKSSRKLEAKNCGNNNYYSSAILVNGEKCPKVSSHMTHITATIKVM